MTVKLDLRINKQDAAAEIKETGRHYLLFFAAACFFILSAFIFTISGYRIYMADSQRAEILKTIETDKERTAALDKELLRLSSENGASEAKLDFILGNIPSIELLSDINEKLIDGIAIESVSMNAATAVLKGVAFADEEVVQFSESLSEAPAVKSVALPIITGDKRNGVGIRAFTIEVKLKPLQDILEDGLLNGRSSNGFDARPGVSAAASHFFLGAESAREKML